MIVIDSNFEDIDKLNEIALDEGALLLINKPLSWTSFDVVNKVRYVTKVKKVGHAGTLDPLATGLILLGLGKGTKKIDQLILLNKVYKAIFRLGATTQSYDSEFPEENIKQIRNIDLNKIQNLINEKFTGEISQIPPQFSAKKVKGKRAYLSAREGKEVELAPVNLTINKFEVIRYQEPFLESIIDCSKGTYIRAIARDLGEELGCGGYMCNLVRESIGEYKLEDAFELTEFIDRVSNDKSI